MKKGFTLIELLIVVAIIAILAAIAVPNFLEAQVRAKTSRAKADMRTYSTALESYRIDTNCYPFCNTFGVDVNNTAVPNPGTNNYSVLENLTTPISYVTSLLQDAFVAKRRTGSVINGTAISPGMNGAYSAQPEDPAYKRYFYQSTTPTDRGLLDAAGAPIAGKPIAYVVFSAGPDLISTSMGGVLANCSRNPPGTQSEALSQQVSSSLIYDTTNGTISFGDIYRVGGETGQGYGGVFYQSAQSQSMK